MRISMLALAGAFLLVTTAAYADDPMAATYGSAVSGLNPGKQLLPFLLGNLRNFCKRIVYTYFLRDFNVGSIEITFGLPLCVFGFVYGILHWGVNEPATAGTVMIARAARAYTPPSLRRAAAPGTRATPGRRRRTISSTISGPRRRKLICKVFPRTHAGLRIWARLDPSTRSAPAGAMLRRRVARIIKEPC